MFPETVCISMHHLAPTFQWLPNKLQFTNIGLTTPSMWRTNWGNVTLTNDKSRLVENFPVPSFKFCEERYEEKTSTTCTEHFSLERSVQDDLQCSSGKLRHWRCLRNAGCNGWVFAWRGYMTQRLLSVKRHLSLTLQLMCQLQMFYRPM
jgi:hypothetical protein